MKKLGVVLFAQMLPATLVVAAIRPLFARFHGGDVSMMHAFMSLNMVGAIIAVPPLAMLADRMRRPRRMLIGLAAADALLLFACAFPISTALVLVLRFLEGAAHVGATSLLLAEAAALARRRGEGHVMGLAGAAIVFAIAGGSAAGGLLVAFAPQVPFFAAALISLAVAAAMAVVREESGPRPLPAGETGVPVRPLLLPLSAAFIERFGVGCMVVSFSLFAHARHALSDSAIGWLFFALTFTFALAMAPAGRLADRIPANVLLPLGALVYGGALLALAHAATAWLTILMVIAGAAAALMFAPALTSAAEVAGDRRAGAMALLNVAGCFGMTLGTATSGIAVSMARRAAADPVNAYAVPIIIAAGVLIVWGALAFVLVLRAENRGQLTAASTR